jgi:two-component system C4-dicarboxylate transport sensor histidine kinase DctB
VRASGTLTGRRHGVGRVFLRAMIAYTADSGRPFRGRTGESDHARRTLPWREAGERRLPCRGGIAMTTLPWTGRSDVWRRQRAVLPIALGLVLIGLAAWSAHAFVLRRELAELSATARQRLDVEAVRLDAQLTRYEYLPSLLETAPEVMDLLRSPTAQDHGDKVSLYLKSLNAIAGADNLYVLNLGGRAVAAADFEQPSTPRGHDLSFRPYLREALANGRGRFFGVGSTTGKAGYYLSYALASEGRRLGAATVKVPLETIESEWRERSGELLLVDENNVVILATNSAWRYRPLDVMPPAAREEAAQSRRYGPSPLEPLRWTERPAIIADARRIALGESPAKSYLLTERRINQGQWRLIELSEETEARAVAWTAALAGGLAGAVMCLVLGVLALRRRTIRLQLATREALRVANDQLEIKVMARTEALRVAQDELVHAGKLAALGQMSAGIVHELNQPLAALQTISDNAALLISRGRLDEAQGNLHRIADLIARLGRLTNQLKGFAHRAKGPPGVVAVRKVLDDVLWLHGELLRKEKIDVRIVAIEPGDLIVVGDAAGLEQVVGNLISNAIDALAKVDAPHIEIEARDRGATAVIAIRNNGARIADDILPRLFEPFFTTKAPGRGLGLGLLISSHVIRGYGGHIRVRNLDPTGVEFTVELPRAVKREAGNG